MEWRSHRVQMGDHWLIFESEEELGPELDEVALRELNETPERRAEALKQFRELIQERGEFELGLDDDRVLGSFLRTSHYYVDSAYKRLMNHVLIQERLPKWFAELVPSNDAKTLEKNLASALPYRDSKGRRVLLLRVGTKWKVKETSLNELIRCVLLLVWGGMIEPKTQVAGAVIILDLAGISLSHVWQMSPTFASNLLHYVQECVGLRLKAVHIINEPSFFNMLFSIFKPFISEKLRQRIYFHGSERGNLCDAVGSKILPISYGGELDINLDCGNTIQELLQEYEPMYLRGSQNRILKKKK